MYCIEPLNVPGGLYTEPLMCRAAYVRSRLCTEPLMRRAAYALSRLCVEALSRCVLKVCCAWDAYVWGPLYAGLLIASR
jgi:hypothetical protein